MSSLRNLTGQKSARTQVLEAPEIGSNFELVEDRYLTSNMSRRLPWEGASEITYVESGRQALAVVEAELRSQGHTHLHVPSYLCDSMIYPFQSHGWTIAQLQVDNDLAVSPTVLLAQVTAGVLLHAPYFGRQDSPAIQDALDALRQRGVVLVVDETHRVFSDPSPVADIRVASLRKSLPLYDGGYVSGLSGPPHPALQRSPSDSEVAALRRTAMRSKSDALASGDDNQAYRALFAEAEHATEIRTQPAHMSEESLLLLHRLDIDLIRRTREINSILLSETLCQSNRFRIINPPTEDLLPSHLVLETDDVSGLQQYLAGQRVYCPIHWPPSELLLRTGNWPSRYISLPIDHRYSEPAMLRMAGCIKTFFERSHKGSIA
jgi:hypothetical protein